MQEHIDEFKNRFNKAISAMNIKPVELAQKTGLSKSTISHYMSGYTKPKSDKLYILAKALNVNEAWLMGLDVPMERNDYEDQKLITYDAKVDAIYKLLKDNGFYISDSNNINDDIIIILNSDHEVLSSMHEYELVNKYDSLTKHNTLSAQKLVEKASSGWEKIDPYLTAKKASESIYNKFTKNIARFPQKEREICNIYEQLSSDNQAKVLLYSKNLLSNQKMEEDLNAANDQGATPEQKAHADSIMENDSEWE